MGVEHARYAAHRGDCTAALHTPAYAQLLPDTAQIILWVTTSSWQRAHTIRQIWAAYTC